MLPMLEVVEAKQRVSTVLWYTPGFEEGEGLERRSRTPRRPASGARRKWIGAG
jgi:hypothetical protein